MRSSTNKCYYIQGQLRLEHPITKVLLHGVAFKMPQNGLIFFCTQANLTNDLQKALIWRLDEVTSRPATFALQNQTDL